MALWKNFLSFFLRVHFAHSDGARLGRESIAKQFSKLKMKKIMFKSNYISLAGKYEIHIVGIRVLGLEIIWEASQGGKKAGFYIQFQLLKLKFNSSTLLEVVSSEKLLYISISLLKILPFFFIDPKDFQSELQRLSLYNQH